MDFTLDVLIKKDDIDKINLSESLVEWGGEFFSQEPTKYKNKSELVFEEFTDLDYYKDYYRRFLENDLDNESYIALRLLGTHMFDLELLVNNCGDDLSNNDVMLFLQELFNLDSFAIFLIRDEECIDVWNKINTEVELIDIVYDGLNRKSPKGVLVTKNIE